MSKIARVFQSLFASGAGGSDVGEFGSKAAGDPTYTSDPATIQSLGSTAPKFIVGLAGAVDASKRPYMEDINGLFLLAFRQIAYLFQAGVPEYDASTTYYTGSIVQVSGALYQSLEDTNLGNTPSAASTHWAPYASSGYKEIKMTAGTVAEITTKWIGWQLCDGTNGTPDLRDKFVVGAKQDDSGVAKTNVSGALTKSGGAATVNLAHTHAGGAGSGLGSYNAPYNNDIKTDSQLSATQSVLNPYYALCFIMKV